MYCAGVDCRPEKYQLTLEDKKKNFCFVVCAEDGELDCDSDEWAQWTSK